MAKQADYTKTVTDTVAEFQTRAKAAYDKGAALAGEATEFTKGNIEAFVESSKILTENLQDLGKVYADEAKAAFETFTADLKELAAVKSPTELFQLQSRLARRNFDSRRKHSLPRSAAPVTSSASSRCRAASFYAADRVAISHSWSTSCASLARAVP